MCPVTLSHFREPIRLTSERVQETYDKNTVTDFYLFFSCDGYRCLFSGYEIFHHTDGDDMIIVDTMDGQPTEHGLRLTPAADFFADRSMWGLCGVVRISPPADPVAV